MILLTYFFFLDIVNPTKPDTIFLITASFHQPCVNFNFERSQNNASYVDSNYNISLISNEIYYFTIDPLNPYDNPFELNISILCPVPTDPPNPNQTYTTTPTASTTALPPTVSNLTPTNQISSTPTTNLTPGMSNTSLSKSNKLSDGEIIGITIGGVVTVILIATVVVLFVL